MSNYIGVRCPVCNKKFTEADDIVVCPVCGAPHHRHCYAEKNQCAFVADHMSGKEWSDPAAEIPPHEQAGASDAKPCSRCGSVNPEGTIFCQTCGNPMTISPPKQDQQQPGQWAFPGFPMQVDAISMAYGGLSPDETIGGESVRDIAQYVGSGSAYYLPRFRIMSEHGRTITPNLSAFVFNFLFYFYRKMYMLGVVMLALYIVSMIPNFLYTREVFPQLLQQFGFIASAEINQAAADHYFWLSGITRSINLTIGFIVSMCANRFYYSRVITSVNEIRTSQEGQEKNQQSYNELLARSGGCSKVAVAVVIALLFVANLAFASYLMYVNML